MTCAVAPSNVLVRIEFPDRIPALSGLCFPLPQPREQGDVAVFLTVFSHHPASRAQAGVLGRRGLGVESAAARAAARLEEGLPVDTIVVSVPSRRDCQTRGSRQRRSCSRGSQVAQGADLPGIYSDGPPSQVGGPSLRSWR